MVYYNEPRYRHFSYRILTTIKVVFTPAIHKYPEMYVILYICKRERMSFASQTTF